MRVLRFDFQTGDIIAVTATPDDGWWSGELLDETRRRPGRNVFPSNFVAMYVLTVAVSFFSSFRLVGNKLTVWGVVFLWYGTGFNFIYPLLHFLLSGNLSR